jgi:hypothetical protein
VAITLAESAGRGLLACKHANQAGEADHDSTKNDPQHRGSLHPPPSKESMKARNGTPRSQRITTTMPTPQASTGPTRAGTASRAAAVVVIVVGALVLGAVLPPQVPFFAALVPTMSSIGAVGAVFRFTWAEA